MLLKTKQQQQKQKQTNKQKKQQTSQPEEHLIICLHCGLGCASLQSSASPRLFSKPIPKHTQQFTKKALLY